jgi:hypothetical protein
MTYFWGCSRIRRCCVDCGAPDSRRRSYRSQEAASCSGPIIPYAADRRLLRLPLGSVVHHGRRLSRDEDARDPPRLGTTAGLVRRRPWTRGRPAPGLSRQLDDADRPSKQPSAVLAQHPIRRGSTHSYGYFSPTSIIPALRPSAKRRTPRPGSNRVMSCTGRARIRARDRADAQTLGPSGLPSLLTKPRHSRAGGAYRMTNGSYAVSQDGPDPRAAKWRGATDSSHDARAGWMDG